MDCELLDDYICKSLSSENTEAFEQHLEHCGECHAAVKRETALFGILTEASLSLEVVPKSIVLPASSAPPRQARRSGFAVAVSVLSLLGWIGVSLTTSVPEKRISSHRAEAVSPSTVSASPQIELPTGTNAISIASGDPNIKIILMNSPEPTEINFLEPTNGQHLASSL